MKNACVIGALAAFALFPAIAMAADSGAAAGAVAGGAAGAVVGGPVGAAVGAGVGGLAGGAATGPDKNVVIEHREPDTTGSVNCGSKTVHKENDLGESKTVTRERCD